jgi:signal transduction histidine kinase
MPSNREASSVTTKISREQPLRPAVADAIEGIAHGLRGPLANLSIMYEIVETLRQSSDASNERDTLIFHLVEQARRTGDALGYTETLVDLGDVIRSATTLWSRSSAVQNVCVAAQLPPAFCVLGDAQLLIEAVDALIEAANARRAPSGLIHVDAERTGRTVSINVNFPAMTDDLPAAVKKKLWLSRLIAIRHGGALESGSTPGGLQRLSITLPTSLR